MMRRRVYDNHYRCDGPDHLDKRRWDVTTLRPATQQCPQCGWHAARIGCTERDERADDHLPQPEELEAA